MALKPFLSKPAICLVIGMFFYTQSIEAQNRRFGSGTENSWEVGLSGGVSQFLASVNPNSDAPYKRFNYWNADYNPAISLSVIKNFSPKFSAELELMTTKLSGDWNTNGSYGIPYPATEQDLPAPFKTGIKQFMLMFVPNLNQIIAPNSSNNRWYLFLKAGIGGLSLKEYSGLFPYAKPKGGFTLAFAYGGGVSYAVNDKFKLKLGANWNRVNTDRLDGVHTQKPGGDPEKDEGFYYNVTERYIYPYIGVTYGLGTIQSKAHFLQRNNTRFLWFKKSSHRYKRR